MTGVNSWATKYRDYEMSSLGAVTGIRNIISHRLPFPPVTANIYAKTRAVTGSTSRDPNLAHPLL